MTWQRIDENTYIDDTLVTCAEYQLFIDEMREQGKYYQPDHWTSFQFPVGQAREPILGVRHSDAVAFCEWLTLRKSIEWVYRLPIREETIQLSIKSHPKTPLGYWINPEFQFIWIRMLREDARAIDLELDRKLLHELVNKHNLGLNGSLDLGFEHMLDRSPNHIRSLDLFRNQIRSIARRFKQESDFVFGIYTDFSILKNRIEGRSIATESIRLAKERIQ